MHRLFNLKMRTCLFLFGKKRIVVTPGITGETISRCRSPAIFGSRVLNEIAILRHNKQTACAFACCDERSEVFLLWRYVLRALSQLATRASSRGLIQQELQLANFIIGLLGADSLTC